MESELRNTFHVREFPPLTVDEQEMGGTNEGPNSLEYLLGAGQSKNTGEA
ncbi:hypothetical protein ACFQ3N_03470 [Virgibacillus byunsanensis]|uniref:Uncharacterized protein n=1 Tax=Virgibacillus byunsanensis TaxID=570945 RepID=A0ABW3LJ44_9BACI